MKQTPLLFKPHLVEEIIAQRKTQSRRVVNAPSHWSMPPAKFDPKSLLFMRFNDPAESVKSPYGGKGDLIWVKESWRVGSTDRNTIWYRDGMFKGLSDTADNLSGKMLGERWKSSMFMYRWASRIDLLIAEIRVERLQDISEDDARAEGVIAYDGMLDEVKLCARAKEMKLTADDARVWFAEIWDSINAAKHPWSSNPFVWVINFSIKQVSI